MQEIFHSAICIHFSGIIVLKNIFLYWGPSLCEYFLEKECLNSSFKCTHACRELGLFLLFCRVICYWSEAYKKSMNVTFPVREWTLIFLTGFIGRTLQ